MLFGVCTFKNIFGHFFLSINDSSVSPLLLLGSPPIYRCYSCVSFNFRSLSFPSNGIVQMLPKCSFELERLSTLFQIKSFVNISKWQENAFYGVFINLCQNQVKKQVEYLLNAFCSSVQRARRYEIWKLEDYFQVWIQIQMGALLLGGKCLSSSAT